MLIKIYTDGACSQNPGPGGWGAVLICNDIEKEISGFCDNTTNNQMELTAAIEAIKSVKEQSELQIFTDSQYVKNGITQWIFNWQKNNWKTANRQEVKNKQLWIELLSCAEKHQISWNWVKGHCNDCYNERADQLARLAIEQNVKNYL